MASRPLFILGLLLLLTSCAEISPPPSRIVTRTAVDFSDLDGWRQDHILQSVPALNRSCAVLKHKAGWADLCAALATAPPHDDDQARQFYEHWFRPYAIRGRDGAEGLFTGYYEAELHGAKQQDGSFQTPLYARPDDLITVDLGVFKPDLQGQHIVGKVEAGKNGKQLTPYDDRTQINAGSLIQRAQPLVWVKDPVDAFFLAIQGSGRVDLPDHSVLRLGYDAANGRAYVAIGKILADKNELEKPVTMQSIRAWMTAHPAKAQQIMNLNPSYVFFKILTGDEPVGAEGVALTPERSLAVDPGSVALGSPVWIDTVDGKNEPLQRLVLAQDTGGAIKGAVRGDVFWGYGAAAEAQAGAMQSKGRYFVLIPKSAGSPDDPS